MLKRGGKRGGAITKFVNALNLRIKKQNRRERFKRIMFKSKGGREEERKAIKKCLSFKLTDHRKQHNMERYSNKRGGRRKKKRGIKLLCLGLVAK